MWEIAEPCSLEDLNERHDVNYPVYYQTLYWSRRLSLSFAAVQFFGMFFTYFAMFNSMLAYTIFMWLGTITTFSCFGLTLAYRSGLSNLVESRSSLNPEKIRHRDFTS